MLKSFLPLLVSILILTSFATPCLAQAPSWAKVYDAGGGGGAQDVRQTSDGGFLAAGWTKAFVGANTDMWLVKLDAAGNILWQRSYGGPGRDEIFKLHPTTDGGFIGIGLSSSFGANQHAPLVLKFDVNGNVQWQKTYLSSGRDWGVDIIQTSDGGYVIPGQTDPCACGGATQGTVLKITSTGDIVWQKIYTGQSTCNSIQQTPDGGYIAAGSTVSFGAGSGDLLVLKLDSTGNILWQKTYGGSGQDGVGVIQLTADGGYILTGATSSFGAGGFDTWLLKLASDGTVVWQKAYGGPGTETPSYVEQTSDGGFIVSGQTTSFALTGTDLWVFKTDASGNLIWQRVYDSGSPTDIADAVHQTSDGGFAVAGMSDPSCPFGCVPSPLPQRFTILKLKSDGSIDPSCPAGVGTGTTATVQNTTAAVQNAPLTSGNFNASAINTNVTVSNTSATVTTLCAGSLPPVTRTLTVASTNPTSGVAITVSPSDNNGQGNGTSPFMRNYNNGVVVSLGAPATAGANNFSSWTGCDSTSGVTCTVAANADRIVTVNYTTPPPPSFRPTLSVNGNKLAGPELDNVLFVATKVVPQLLGNRAERIRVASIAAWWGLREGTFGLPDVGAKNAFVFSLCDAPKPRTHLKPLEVCEPGVAWQVGLAAVFVPNFPDEQKVLNTVQMLWPTRTVMDVLAEAAQTAGFDPTGSTTGAAIVSSTGVLRKSWLLRHTVVGMTLEEPIITARCIQPAVPPSDCIGVQAGNPGSQRYASTKQEALQSISDLAIIFERISP